MRGRKRGEGAARVGSGWWCGRRTCGDVCIDDGHGGDHVLFLPGKDPDDTGKEPQRWTGDHDGGEKRRAGRHHRGMHGTSG